MATQSTMVQCSTVVPSTCGLLVGYEPTMLSSAHNLGWSLLRCIMAPFLLRSRIFCSSWRSVPHFLSVLHVASSSQKPIEKLYRGFPLAGWTSHVCPPRVRGLCGFHSPASQLGFIPSYRYLFFCWIHCTTQRLCWIWTCWIHHVSLNCTVKGYEVILYENTLD